MTLSVTEIFHSIQGESVYAGLPCVLVRLAGCNLRCRYCDTTYGFAPGKDMTTAAICGAVAAYPCRLVEITGGEPLLQEETPLLITRLLDRGHTVLLETNGTIDITPVDRRCVVILDVKCPGSGFSHKNDLDNIHRLPPGGQIKFVITSRRDYEFAKTIIQDRCRAMFAGDLLLSPAHSMLSPALLAEWMLADGTPARLQLQLHKYIWPHEDKGR